MSETNQENVRGEVGNSVNYLLNVIDSFHHIKKFLELAESSECPLFIAYSQPNGKFKYVNQPFADEMQYTKDEMCSTPWTKFMDKDEAEKVKTDYFKGLEIKKSFKNYRTVYIRKDGSKLDLIWFTSPVYTEVDKLTLCFAVKQQELLEDE